MGFLRVQEIYRAFMLYKAGENTRYGDILEWIYGIICNEVKGEDGMSPEEVAMRFNMTNFSDGLDVAGFEAYMYVFLNKLKNTFGDLSETSVRSIIDGHNRCLEAIKKCMEKQ